MWAWAWEEEEEEEESKKWKVVMDALGLDHFAERVGRSFEFGLFSERRKRPSSFPGAD